MTSGKLPTAPEAHPPRRVSVYIDGFNLYYGSLKGTPYKWLDPFALACALMPGDQVTAVHYFTARVKPTPRNPKVEPRNPVNPKVPNPANPTVEIWMNEEKGSDVNLATQFLLDAFDDNYDLAVVITNDSDLAWPILKVRQKFRKAVGVYKPERPAGYPGVNPRPDSKELKNNARWFRHIEARHLIASQLPTTLTDATGTITKPPTW